MFFAKFTANIRFHSAVIIIINFNFFIPSHSKVQSPRRPPPPPALGKPPSL